MEMWVSELCDSSAESDSIGQVSTNILMLVVLVESAYSNSEDFPNH